MKIEEAKEQLISLKENAKVNIDTDEIFRLDYEAITFVLNELDKKDKQIRLMADILQDNLYFSPLDGLNKEELIEYFYKKAEEK